MKIWTVNIFFFNELDFENKLGFNSFQHPWLLRPHFIDRWKKRQKRGETEADKIDPFFNDITGVSDDEVAADEENNKKSTSKKKLSPKKQVRQLFH